MIPCERTLFRPALVVTALWGALLADPSCPAASEAGASPVWRPALSWPLASGGVGLRPPAAGAAEDARGEHLEFDPDRRAIHRSWRVRDVDVTRPEMLGLDARLAALCRESRRAAWVGAEKERRRLPPEEAGRSLLGELTHIDIPIQFPSAVSSIIGQGANIDVSGSEDITFGGESNYVVEAKDYGFGQRSRFPQLDMRQRLRVNLNGTIGEKIQVQVDHDSEVQTALENKIKLRYVGNEDEVVQSIEMGNTNLSLGGAQFVGYSGQAQGLFGAKMTGRLGNLNFTTIASKQEGRTSRETFIGQAREEEVVIRDVDYEKRRFFAVLTDTSLLSPIIPTPIESLSVWVADYNVNNDAETAAQPGLAYRFLIPTADARYDSTTWVRLDEVQDYTVNKEAGVIALAQALRSDWSLAVAYYSPNEGGWVGDDRASILRLQMLRPANSITNNWFAGTEAEGYANRTPWYPLLGLELKHVYSLGARNIASTDYEIHVRRTSRTAGIQEDHQGGTPFIQLMGLDRGTYSSAVSDTTTPDGIVDPQWIDFDAGLLYLPNYRPFDPSPFLGYDYDLEDRNPSLYKQSEEYLRLHPELQLYEITALYRTPQTTFRLNRVGIIRDSEVITLNGQRLARGVDYQIDYDLGQVTFLTDEAARADAQIAIDFEYAPFLAQAQKTLFGLSGEYKFSEQNRVGMTWLYETTTTPELRPRLGQEPTRTLVGDLNFQWQGDSDWATGWVNALPLVTARTPSQFRLAGEVAASLPNPNVKDEVYLDDMDGTEDVRTLGTSWRLWVPASRPVGVSEPSYRPNWYSPRDLVKERDLFLGLTGNEGDAYRTVLELRSHPAQADSGTGAWVGIMRLLSTEGSNLSEQKFLEVWVDDGPVADRGGVMHLDLGDMSEDFYRPQESTLPDDEDVNHDGILDEPEDVGLDRVKGTDGTGVPGDDGNDDFDYDFDRARREYETIDGTEANRIRDTEDLNRNGRLDRENGYYTVAVDLANEDTTFVATDNARDPRAAGSTWRLYRIPLSAFGTPSGLDKAPTWTAIRMARLWFTGFKPSRAVRIGSLEIIGNAWLEDGVHDAQYGTGVYPDSLAPFENVSVQVRNNKEHSEYTPPFDVGEEQTPQGRIARREQSLALVYEQLGPGHIGSGHKTILQASDAKLNDYSEYRSLSFFVRAQQVEPPGRPPIFFVRFGADSADFYEYRVRLDESQTWRSVDVSLDDLPRIKLLPADTTITYNRAPAIAVRDAFWGAPAGAPPPEALAVYGRPSLTRVLFLAVGIRNEWGEEVSGQVWVDELRLRRVRRERGTVGTLSMSTQLADLASANLSYTKKGSEFRTLSSDRSGSDETRGNFGGRINLHKFFEGLGIALPLSFNAGRSERLPRLLTGSDIVLDEDLQRRERTFNQDQSVSLGLSHPTSSKSAWGRLFLDGFQANASSGRSRSTSPELEGASRDLRGDVQYTMVPPFEPRLNVWRGLKVEYLPQSMTMRANGSRVSERSYSVAEGTRGAVRVDRVTRSIEGTWSVRGTPLQAGSMSTDYSFEMYRDLDTDKSAPAFRSLGWGTETRRAHGVGWRFQPSLFGLATPLLTYQASYDENESPQIRRSGDPAGLRQVQNSGEFRASTSLSPQSLLRKLSSWWGERERRREESRPKALPVEPLERAGGEEGPPPGKMAPVPEEEGPPPGKIAPLPGEEEEGGATPGEEKPLPREEASPEGERALPPPEGPPDSTRALPLPGGGEPGPPGPRAAEPPAPETPAPRPPGPGILERLARGSRKVQDIAINVSTRRSSRQRTLERPPLGYQLGFALEAPGEYGRTLDGQTSSSRSRSRSVSLRGGLRPLTAVGVDMTYTGTVNKQDAAGSASEQRSRSWPDLTLNVSSLERLPALQRWMQRASFTSSLRRKVDQTITGGELRDSKSQLALSPLFQLSSTMTSGLQLTVTGNHTRSTADNRRGVGSKDRSISSSLQVGTRYAFRPKRAPGGGAAKNKEDSGNEIKLSVDFRLNTDKTERLVGTSSSWEMAARTSGFTLEPEASYSFQTNMTGSARATLGQTRDHKRGETRRRIGLFASLSIRF